MINSKQYILLNPGPVNITKRVRQALLLPDLCHREEEFTSLMQQIRTKLLQVYSLDPELYTAILLTGSGTAAVEAALISLCAANGHLLIITNGVYGERIEAIAKAYGIDATVLSYEWGEEIKIADIEQKLRDNPQITTVAVIHHETTTGILNNLAEIGRCAKSFKKKLFIDAVSSFGGEELLFDKWGLDICCGTSNKCLHGVPGASFVITRRDIIKQHKDTPPKSVYLDLVNYYHQEEKGIPPFTPTVQVMYAFNESLDELLEKGVLERINSYKKRATQIRQLSQEIGLTPYIPFNLLCNTLTSFTLPSSVTYEQLHDYLKEKGYIIYAGQGRLKSDIFRIANLGTISSNEIDILFTHIKTIIH